VLIHFPERGKNRRKGGSDDLFTGASKKEDFRRRTGFLTLWSWLAEGKLPSRGEKTRGNGNFTKNVLEIRFSEVSLQKNTVGDPRAEITSQRKLPETQRRRSPTVERVTKRKEKGKKENLRGRRAKKREGEGLWQK